MVTVKIKENSKEAAALLEYLGSLSYVEIEGKPRNTAGTPKPDREKLDEIAQKINKATTRRMTEAHGMAR